MEQFPQIVLYSEKILMYRKFKRFLERFFKRSTVMKILFALSPAFRRTGGRVVSVSEDIKHVVVKVKFSYKTHNYVGTLFGGSMFAASDPFYMVQYVELLGRDYVVWDRAGSIRFKKPAREDAYMEFLVTDDDITQIKKEVKENGRYVFTKRIKLTNKDKTVVFAIIEKEIYVASKEYYKNRNSVSSGN